MELNPVHVSRQKLARLAVGTILYQCRVGRAQKPVLEMLGHLLCQIMEALLRGASVLSSGTPSLVQYEGIEGNFVSLRRSPDFVHEASLVVDLALTCLAVNPSPAMAVSGAGRNTWNPDYSLAELLEYAKIQGRFGEGQQASLQRLVGPGGGRQDGLPKSIFENSGFINVAYSITPRPVLGVEAIEAADSQVASREASEPGEPVLGKHALEAIQEEPPSTGQ